MRALLFQLLNYRCLRERYDKRLVQISNRIESTCIALRVVVYIVV